MKTFTIKTLGCKVNQCESEAIGNALVEGRIGLRAGEDSDADIVIVNTCAVTRKAAMQSRQAVRQAVRTNPRARIVVTGCHAQTAAAELTAIEGVDLVIGNREKLAIPQRLGEACLDADISHEAAICGNVDGARRFDPLPAIAHGGRTRPYLKVQDGCNAFCTYCIVPHARGRSRSLPMEQVLNQIAALGRLGYHEVVLTGIHIGCYGQDLTPAIGLYDLLCRIREAGAIDRVRVSSIEPGELSDEIVDLAATDREGRGLLCRHFHVPLQSGDDGILKRMHRPYTRQCFRDRVLSIAEQLPDAAIGVDTLIGFPGESDAAFENTRSLIDALPVAYLHVFPFSRREGTPAFSYPDQVPPAVIKNRCRRMRRLGSAKRAAFYERFMGESCSVLVEETRDRDDGSLKGLTDNYVPVRLQGPDSLFNTFQTVRIDGVGSSGVPEGKLV